MDSKQPGAMKGISQGIGSAASGIGAGVGSAAKGTGEAVEAVGHGLKRLAALGEDSVKDDNFGTLEMEAEQLPAADGYMQVGVSLAEINKQGKELWAGKDGNVGSPELNAVRLPEMSSKAIPVYKGMQDAMDEVSPTQSDPADKRSDNLLSPEHGGM